MINLKPLILFFSLQLVVLGTAWAQNTSAIKIESVSTGGTGCPAGSVAASISPDSSAMSFLFSQYAFDARQGAQIRRECSLNFQVTPPAGYQLKVLTIDYRGFAALSKGAKARFTTQVLQQHEGDSRMIGRSSQDYVGAMNDNFAVSTGSGAGTWTSCGGRPVAFSLNSSLEVVNRSNDVATVSVDSTDVALGAGTVFYLAWSKCIDGRPDPQHGGGGPSDGRGGGNGGGGRGNERGGQRGGERGNDPRDGGRPPVYGQGQERPRNR